MTFPTVETDIRRWKFDESRDYVSLDFEFGRDNAPTLVGLSSGGHAGSFIPSERVTSVLRTAFDRGLLFAGHNSISADGPILDKVLGVHVPLEQHEDTMIRHYLCNADFVSMPKNKGEDDEASRGIGLLDLWSMASLYTDLPAWKQCRDGLRWFDAEEPAIHCDGPCPVHAKQPYNGVDAWAVDDALPRLRAEMHRKHIPEGLYDRTKEHTEYCRVMQIAGVKVDMVLVAALEKEFDEHKRVLFPTKQVARLCGTCSRMGVDKRPCKRCKDARRIIQDGGIGLLRHDEEYDAPFAPTSPKQIAEYFGIGSTTKDDIEQLLESLSGVKREWGERLFDFKDEGKGLKGWFGEKYVDKDSIAHSRFIPTGASTGRTSSADPNFQNIPKVGFGKRVRGAIVVRDSSLVLVRADYKNLEFRTCLWYAFVKTLGREFPNLKYDAFVWLLERVGSKFDDLSRRMVRSHRDIAKSVSHAANYLEGVRIFKGRELDSTRTKQLIERGALVVYRDWRVGGGVVGFTGVNLAKRLFGSATDDFRKQALDIQEIYFSQVPEIRQWHRAVGEDVDRGFVRSATGRYLTLRGTIEDKYKAATAFLGQGAGADVKIESVLCAGRNGTLPIIDLHDELVFERDRGLSVENHRDFMKGMMERQSELLPGFFCPVDIEIGANWGKKSDINPKGMVSIDKWDPSVL